MPIPAPLSLDDLSAYALLREGAVCFHRAGLHHLEFSGAKAADALTGLVTNNVLALGVGSGQYAAALTAKGRIVADMRIVRIGDEQSLTTTRDAAWTGWRDLVRKFVNPRLAKYAERSFETLAVHGPSAHRIVQESLAALGASSSIADSTEMYACTRIAVAEHELFVVESPELGNVPGVELLVPHALLSQLLDALTHAGAVVRSAAEVPALDDASVVRSAAQVPALDNANTDAPRTPIDAVWEVARVEAGRPSWGRDMDETTIPQEANLGDLHAISFDKGCYTGQETVARIHFRGHVNRHLRVLSSDIPLPLRSELRAQDGKVIGDVRSSVISPSSGPLAIAMVRREFSPGDRITVFAEDAEVATAAITEVSGPPPAPAL